LVLDVLVSLAILLNALMIGVRADVDRDWYGWEVLENCFLAFFIVEMMMKLKDKGLVGHFFGPDWYWNGFDASIVLMAIGELIAVAFVFNEADEAGPTKSLTMLRLVRLARLARLVRLLRFNFFKELVLMIKGVFAGLRTLMWAIVLLVIETYVIGVLLRNTIGSEETLPGEALPEERFVMARLLFSTVPRSMFTIFRCLTDGCSSTDGTPLMVTLHDAYGHFFIGAYVVVFVCTTFGLFNLILAIFVESTMQAAKHNEQKIQMARQSENMRVAMKLKEFVLRLTTGKTADQEGPDGKKSGVLAKFFPKKGKQEPITEADQGPGVETDVSREIFQKVLDDPVGQALLDDLEIALNDRGDLFDVLDADASGSLTVTELVSGLLKVRGVAGKSDVVATRLAIRSLQDRARVFEAQVLHSQRVLEEAVMVLHKLVMDTTSVQQGMPFSRSSDCARPSSFSKRRADS